MPIVPLPADPSLEQLRKQAKDLVRVRPELRLADAQLEIARRHGFPSWARLRRHLAVVERYSRGPDTVETATDPAAEFLRLACLTYGDDDPERRTRARALLAAHPEIGRAGVHTAAATADSAEVRRLLAAEPGLAVQEGGPFGWQPLFYLAYARHDPDVPAAAVLETARLLLEAGADPNAGYLWHGLPSPFTLLTGAFGSGESGQPPHPHSIALARLLLEAGADPNDAQALYNRQFAPADDHLRLLLDHGLGTGDGGPWRARLGEQLASPADQLRKQLWWAIVHDMRARVALLAEHSPVDLHAPADDDGRTSAELAAVNGHAELTGYLVSRGVAAPRPEGVDAFVGASLAGRRDVVERLRDLAGAAREARPALIVWAAALRRAEAVELLAEFGFDVNAMGRSDIPREQPWETALHCAAGEGDTEFVRLLLALGADPRIRDARFSGTALDWARHFGRDETAALLAGV